MSRIASLEKDVVFLQQQHRDTLGKLHKEIDVLKRLNKELQYKLIMGPNQQQPRRESGSSPTPLEGISDSEQLPAQQGPDRHPHEPRSLDVAPGVCGVGGPPPSNPPVGPLISLSPLRVHNGGPTPPRPPTLRECEAIIQQLCHANKLQAHELSHLKGALRGMVMNHEVPAEARSTHLYMERSGDASEKFPKIPQRAAAPRRLPQGSGADRVVLPSIRPSCSSLTQRQRRAQDTHKTRLRKPVNS
ncbi:coiled-coil domain-containing protein 74B isoform X2 [Engraulis encrasicolus]